MLYFYCKVEKATPFSACPIELLKKVGDTMGNSESKTEYNIKYAKEKLKRIPLDVQKEKYEEIKSAAERSGESVNGYIKKAIDERMERDTE